MTIEMDIDSDCGLSLEEWLKNEKIGAFQRNIETRIMKFLFSQDPNDLQFQQMIFQLAWF